MEVAWLGVYPALPIQLAKLGGGERECSHATSERFFNSYVLVTGGGGRRDVASLHHQARKVEHSDFDLTCDVISDL